MDTPNETKLIPIGSRKGVVGYVIVDAEDYDHLAQWKWCAAGDYAIRGGKNATTLHRLVLERMGIELTGFQVDHINGDKRDCRRANLRRSLPHENSSNRKMAKHNTSGYKGVSKASKTTWMVLIQSRKKTYYLGSYPSTHEAAIIYNRAAVILHGTFARFNDVAPENHVDTSHVDVQAIICGGLKPNDAKQLAAKKTA